MTGFLVGFLTGFSVAVVTVTAYMHDVIRAAKLHLDQATALRADGLKHLQQSMAYCDQANRKLQEDKRVLEETVGMAVEAKALFAEADFDRLVDGPTGGPA